MQTSIKRIPPSFQITSLLLGLILFGYLLVVGADILIPLAFAFMFALFLFPVVRWLERQGFGKIWAILSALSLVILIWLVVFSFIYANIESFSDDLPKMKKRSILLVDRTQHYIEETLKLDSEAQLAWLQRNLNAFVKAGGQLVNRLLNSAATLFTYLLLIPIYTFFMLYYRHILRGFTQKVIKDDDTEARVLAIEQAIINVIQKYVSGLFTVIMIVAVLNITGLLIIGVNHAIFFGLLAALLTIIPYIGVFIGSLLPIVYALVMNDSLFYPIAVLVWFQIVQGLEGNFITPNIVGSQVSLNPMVAIVALLIGAAIWGIAGMILFTPFAAMLKVILDNIPELAPYGYLLGEGKEKPIPKNTEAPEAS